MIDTDREKLARQVAIVVQKAMDITDGKVDLTIRPHLSKAPEVEQDNKEGF